MVKGGNQNKNTNYKVHDRKTNRPREKKTNELYAYGNQQKNNNWHAHIAQYMTGAKIKISQEKNNNVHSFC